MEEIYLKKINKLTEEIKIKVLSFLYEDELFNVFMIHFIENQPENIGELYVTEENNEIIELLHLKFDGNSYFTNFYSRSDEGLKNISKQIEDLDYKRVLLAGKKKDVEKIISILGKKQEVTSNIYYKFDSILFKNKNIELPSNFRKAFDNRKDLRKIKEFLVDFFEANTEEEIRNITNEEKILEELKTGIYFIEQEDEVIGMARYSSNTKQYIDITTVYIDSKYRNHGFGKELMKCMINTALLNNKIPVTQTSLLNKAAMKTYESLGFVKQDDYAFEFIS